MQRSEGNEASFFLHSSLSKGVERRRRGGEEERAGDEKRTETVEENWEEKRHAYASREKERCNPLLSLSLSLQFNFSAFPLGKTFIPTGKPIPAPLQVCETWPQPASFPLEYFSPRRRSSSR